MTPDLSALTDEQIAAGLRYHAAMMNHLWEHDEIRQPDVYRHHATEYRALEAEQKRRAANV